MSQSCGVDMSDQDKPAGLTHLDDAGEVRMVDVGTKDVTEREAIASAIVRMSAATLDMVVANAIPKGNVFTTARVAGILAAKQTSNLIPLTHPLSLTFIDVDFTADRESGVVKVEATVRCQGRTGVEIEAMTACSIAALTIYDMCKGVEKGIVIERVSLERKSGGKSGTYERR